MRDLMPLVVEAAKAPHEIISLPALATVAVGSFTSTPILARLADAQPFDIAR
jgi:hypothetical protein